MTSARRPAGSRPFESVLVANRGEVAARVIRACADLGIRSIAVYSEADRGALHTRLADEAHPVGPGPARDSYLSIERIVEAARRAGAAAVHPGYGFLAENPVFAEACAAAGLTFVGPTPAAMRLLGDKASARRLAAEHGVPTVPGYDGPDQDDDVLVAEADRIGYPLLVKAAAGGGGRGMRLVAGPGELQDALASARREAGGAFGDETLILERLVTDARHVEVQVLGDSFGALIHLGERDCSVQRRHQKVIEESPSPAVGAQLRDELGEAALRVARAAGYTNAGTCEFLLDRSGRFWFIEMNARLQVEHPVTELVTGLDLVRAQLEIAAGQPLRWRQEDVRLHGHALECRVYAEDASRDDLPAPGRIVRLSVPRGPGLRHDLGYGAGDTVPPFYDTMIGKLIASGEDRTTAIERARDALDRYEVEGLPTNRELLAVILDDPTFRAGQHTTDLLGQLRADSADDRPVPPEALAAAVAWELEVPADHESGGTAGDPATAVGEWRIAGQGIITFWLAGGGERSVAVVADREGRLSWRITVSERRHLVVVADAARGTVLVRLGAEAGCWSEAPVRCTVIRQADSVVVEAGGSRFSVRRAPPPSADAGGTGHATAGESALVAPLPGRVVQIDVAVGDVVVERQPLVVVEAMKIESTVAAPRDGVVSAIRCTVGEAVSGGQVLVELAPR